MRTQQGLTLPLGLLDTDQFVRHIHLFTQFPMSDLSIFCHHSELKSTEPIVILSSKHVSKLTFKWPG